MRLDLANAMTAALILVAALTVPARQALADDAECLSGCFRDARVCVRTARVAALACRTDCRATATTEEELFGCLSGCYTTLRGDRRACMETFPVCAEACDVELPDPATLECAADCTHVLGACARDVISSTKACLAECPAAENPLACMGECAATAREGGAACASSYGTCLSACGLVAPAP